MGASIWSRDRADTGTVSSRRTIVFLTALLLALLSGSRASSAPQRSEDGAVARAGTWSTQGGSPARTGVSLSTPVEEDPVEAWRRGLNH